MPLGGLGAVYWVPSGRRHQRCLESTARHGRTGGSANKGKQGGGAEDQVPASANQRGRRAGTRTYVNMHKMPEPAAGHVCRHMRMRGCAGQHTKPRTCDCALRAGKRMSREQTQTGLARADTQMCTHVHGGTRARVLGRSREARARAGGEGAWLPRAAGAPWWAWAAARAVLRVPPGCARAWRSGEDGAAGSAPVSFLAVEAPLSRPWESSPRGSLSVSPGASLGSPRAVWAPRKTRGLTQGRH